MNDIKKKYSFSQPNSFKLVANNGEKVFYLLIIIGVLYTHQDLKGQFLIDVIVLLCIIFIFLVGIGKFVSKLIWRIDIDFDEKIILLNLCRKTSPIQIGFSEIEQIKVSGPIVFLFRNKKYYYSTNEYEEILIILKNVKKITWGKFCNILGPDKSIRKRIDDNHSEGITQ